MKSFCYTLFGDGRKIAQIEQTSPLSVRGYAERRSLFKTQGNINRRNSSNDEFLP